MAEFVPLNGKLLAFGLTWVTISHPKKESSERISFSRAAQAEYLARYTGISGKEIKYGLAKRVTEEVGDQPNGSILSAALLFSHHIASVSPLENSVLVYQIDEKKAAIVALLKGAPYLDIVVKLTELDSQLASLYQEGHTAFVVYGNLPAHATNPVSAINLLLENAKLAALVRFIDPVKRMQRIGVIVVAILMIAGFANWKMTKAKRDAQAATKNVVDPIQIYNQNRQRLLASANFDGAAAFNAIWEVIKKRQVDVAGWSLKNITCKPTQCEELWQQNRGSFSGLRQVIQPPQTIALQPNGETSVITYRLAGNKTALMHSTLPKKEALWIDLVSQQQRLKRLHPALVFTPKPAEIRGLTPDIMAGSIPADLLVYSGEMTVRAPLGLAADILQHHLRNVMVNEVSIDTLGDIRSAMIQIKGTYYAQN